MLRGRRSLAISAVIVALLSPCTGCVSTRIGAEGKNLPESPWARIPWESEKKEDHCVHLWPTYPAVFYDRYLTWRDYDGRSPHRPEQALYIWQGQEMGRGSPGFSRVLSELEKLPPGTRILIYPDYGEISIWDGLSSVGRAFPFEFKFSSEMNRMHEIAVERRLILLYSQRDHRGELVPGVEEKLKWLESTGQMPSIRYP